MNVAEKFFSEQVAKTFDITYRPGDSVLVLSSKKSGVVYWIYDLNGNTENMKLYRVLSSANNNIDAKTILLDYNTGERIAYPLKN